MVAVVPYDPYVIYTETSNVTQYYPNYSRARANYVVAKKKKKNEDILNFTSSFCM